ncbi:hypothetical protein CEQ90_10395 [Lewinellaceae bacterium SD302]|nr:hypothetical protein CEQ90_10395 [Lewinellaceae bacterium SD302]
MPMYALDEELINQPDAPKPVLAAAWFRLGAYLIDGVVLMPIGWLNAYQETNIGSTALAVGLTLLSFAYKPMMEAEKGFTLGKKLVGIKVIRTDGHNIGFREAIIRYFPWFLLVGGMYLLAYLNGIDLSAPVELNVEDINDPDKAAYLTFASQTSMLTIGFLIAVCSMFFNRRRQGMHDMAADTVVIIDPERVR